MRLRSACVAPALRLQHACYALAMHLQWDCAAIAVRARCACHTLELHLRVRLSYAICAALAKPFRGTRYARALRLRCAVALRLQCGWKGLALYCCNGGDAIELPLRDACNALALRWRCACDTHAANTYAFIAEAHTHANVLLADSKSEPYFWRGRRDVFLDGV